MESHAYLSLSYLWKCRLGLSPAWIFILFLPAGVWRLRETNIGLHLHYPVNSFISWNPMNVTWISCSLLPSLVSSSSFLSHADSRGYRSVSLFLLFLWHNLDSPGIYLFNEVNQGRERERRKIMKRNQDPINRFIASKWSLLPLPKTRNINEKSMEESEERRRRER